jgi:hypothetical protein
MELLFSTNNVRLAQLEDQNTELKTDVEEKETVVIQNTEELNNVKNEKDHLDKEASIAIIFDV